MPPRQRCSGQWIYNQRFVTSVAFSSGCKVVAWADSDKSFTLLDAATGAILLTFMDLPSPIRLVTFSPDNKLVASASVDRAVRLWNVASGTMLILEGHMDSVQSVVFSPGSEALEFHYWRDGADAMGP